MHHLQIQYMMFVCLFLYQDRRLSTWSYHSLNRPERARYRAAKQLRARFVELLRHKAMENTVGETHTRPGICKAL